MASASGDDVRSRGAHRVHGEGFRFGGNVFTNRPDVFARARGRARFGPTRRWCELRSSADLECYVACGAVVDEAIELKKVSAE